MERHHNSCTQTVAREKIIEFDSNVVIGCVEEEGEIVLVERDNDGQRTREVRGDVQQMFALRQRLRHQMQLSIVQCLDGLLQVTHTTVNELGTATAGA